MHKNTLMFVTAAVLLTVVVLFFLPIELPYSIKAPGKIIPLKEWVLVRDLDGLLSSTLYDHALGVVESYGVVNVDRGDHVTFRFHPAMITGAYIATGDTIGMIYSNEVELLLTQLKGELATETATLNLNQTGEKESVIREAQMSLIYAQKQAEQQRREVARLRNLATKEMMPAADFERAETTLRLYEIQIDIAEAQLNTVQTGFKEQQIDLDRSRIIALQKEIEILKKRLLDSTMISPIAGRVVCYSNGDTLAVIQDTASYVVIIPVKLKDSKFIAPKQKVTLKIDGFETSPTGTIERLDDTVYSVYSEQVLKLTAIIKDEQKELTPDLVVLCSISCAPITPIEYLWRFLTQ